MKKTLITLVVMGLFIFGMLKYLDNKDKERKQLAEELFVNQRNYDSLMIDSFYVVCDGEKVRMVSSLLEIERLTGNKIPKFSPTDSAKGYSEFEMRYKVWGFSFIRIDSLLALKEITRQPYNMICGEEGDLFSKFKTIDEYKKRFPKSALHITEYERISVHTQMLCMPILNKDPNGIFSHVEVKFNAHDELNSVEYITKVQLENQF